MTPSIAIGFLPRERFELAAESLASLYAHTSLPFELIVMDAGTPARSLQPMLDVLAAHTNWKILHNDGPLLPAVSKNRILAAVAPGTEFVCLLENDNLFNHGWLDELLDACMTYPADVAAPLIREGRGNEGHFDRHLGELVASTTHPGRFEVVPVANSRHLLEQVTPVQFVEQHCLLFRREVFERIGPFDEELNTRDEVDLSLALHHADATVVVVPRSVVNYVPPTSPPEDDELPFYRLRWDLDRAATSRERIQERWSLVETPGDLEFVRYRMLIPRLPEVRARLTDLCRSGRRVVLLENGDWFDTPTTKGIDIRPFPDCGGHFGGFPASPDAARSELAAVLEQGATDIVIGWPAFWWFDHLPGFEAALDAWADTTVRDDLMCIWSRHEPS